MTTDSKTGAYNGSVELATFHVGEALCGIDILNIQEINKLMDMTAVPQAPDYVRGILNLRGQIVTVIDLQKKLDLPDAAQDRQARNIIVNSDGESIGLLVTRIGDVVSANKEQFEAPPANIGDIQGKYFTGVFKTEKELIGILDLKRVLDIED